MRSYELQNGGRFPALGLGTWKSAPGEVGAAVREAVRIGFRHLDCAPLYGNEAEVGSALAEAAAAGEVKREELWITSKLWNSFHKRADVIPALRRTLADLRLDYLDLYLIHWPVAHQPGVLYPKTGAEFLRPEDAPIAETWAAMEEAVALGLVRNIGVSNFTVAKIEKLMRTATIAPAANQVEAHPYFPQNDLFRFCSEHGIVFTAFAPLGSGDRPARVRTEGDPVLLDDPVVRSIADARGVTSAQVLLAWAVERGTCAIPKSSNPARIAQNFAAASLELGADEMAAIAGIDRNYRFFKGALWTFEGSPYTQDWLWDDRAPA